MTRLVKKYSMKKLIVGAVFFGFLVGNANAEILKLKSRDGFDCLSQDEIKKAILLEADITADKCTDIKKTINSLPDFKSNQEKINTVNVSFSREELERMINKLDEISKKLDDRDKFLGSAKLQEAGRIYYDCLDGKIKDKKVCEDAEKYMHSQ